ncbi:MAG: 2Fe-2S iron-sulfur cluster-binding protein, partial [Granulosicoccus sp.]
LHGIEHVYSIDGESPVIQVLISKAEQMTSTIAKYELSAIDGGELPAWDAGAHLDIVVAPEFLRQYSMSGNPSNRTTYQIGVLREEQGRGGSLLMHRIFNKGRKVFVSRPINHFPLIEDANKTFLMAGGIGITPMIAMAHRLYEIGADFELHYSVRSRESMAYLADLKSFPWLDKVEFHCSDENTRLDLSRTFPAFKDGWHVYACGADHYMQAVLDAAERAGFPDGNRHLEYFSVPETPEWIDKEFRLRLVKSGVELNVPADKSAAQVMNENGYKVDIKCSDGLCGVCKCSLISGEVEHRDFVLSGKQREDQIILCSSRALQKHGVIEIDW